MTGKLAQALAWLRETWPEQPSRVALQDRDGFLLIPLSRNFFELPAISQPLDYKLHVEPMIADMAALLATASLVRKAGAVDAKQSRRRDSSQRLPVRPEPLRMRHRPKDSRPRRPLS